MTADIRTAAQAEAVANVNFPLYHPSQRMPVDLTPFARSQFIDGAVWGAARVTPTREQIAEELRRHSFDELLLGSIEWDGYTAVCACGWSSEEYKMPGEAHEAHSEHSAANLLALIGEKIGE